jgi:hypothetical protein
MHPDVSPSASDLRPRDSNLAGHSYPRTPAQIVPRSDGTRCRWRDRRFLRCFSVPKPVLLVLFLLSVRTSAGRPANMIRDARAIRASPQNMEGRATRKAQCNKLVRSKWTDDLNPSLWRRRFSMKVSLEAGGMICSRALLRSSAWYTLGKKCFFPKELQSYHTSWFLQSSP